MNKEFILFFGHTKKCKYIYNAEHLAEIDFREVSPYECDCGATLATDIYAKGGKTESWVKKREKEIHDSCGSECVCRLKNN